MLLEDIAEYYMNCSSSKLVELANEKGGLWDSVFSGHGSEKHPVIAANDEMKRYFRNINIDGEINKELLEEILEDVRAFENGELETCTLDEL